MSKQCLMNAEISLNLQSILQSSIWFNPLSRFQSSSVSKAAARAIYRIGAEPNADKRRERKRAMQEMSAAHSASRRLIISRYPGLVLRHLERERGGQKKGPNAHPIDGMGPSKFQKRGGINQGKAPSKGCGYKLAPQGVSGPQRTYVCLSSLVVYEGKQVYFSTNTLIPNWTSDKFFLATLPLSICMTDYGTVFAEKSESVKTGGLAWRELPIRSKTKLNDWVDAPQCTSSTCGLSC